MADTVSIIPLGGIGDVTRNMYVYEYKDQMLIVDCGLGFPDETMLGVDLLIPDVSYLLESMKRGKRIVGMAITHGHEDHFGALPFVLPQLPPFPIFATRLTAAFANEKLSDFGVRSHLVTVASFRNAIALEPFTVSFLRITHSVPDSAHIVIETPIGVFYHASDFKLDPTPDDNRPSDIVWIKAIGERGVLCLLCDCLRSEKEGHTPSEAIIEENFEREMRECKGKFIVTTYSSNVSRLNQAIRVAKKYGRKVCFLGRSLAKARDIASELGYMEDLTGTVIDPEEIPRYKGDRLMLLVAGSQGQENSAMARLANDEDTFTKVTEDDVVVFSADPIPGNEVAINELIDTLSKKGAIVKYSALTDDLHVSGHAAAEDISDMIRFIKPSYLIPIGGSFRHMVQFRKLAQQIGYGKEKTLLIDNGQEVVFTRDSVTMGEKVVTKPIFVDQTGGEVTSFVLRDRKKLAESGIMLVLLEVDAATGQMVGKPEVIVRGFHFLDKKFLNTLTQQLRRAFGKKRGRVTNWLHLRNTVSQFAERAVAKTLRRRPLVLPIILEV